MRFISVARDTSHVPIDPCEPFIHWPFGESLRHASTALLSCTLDCGENAGLRCALVEVGSSSNCQEIGWGNDIAQGRRAYLKMFLRTHRCKHLAKY